MTTILCVDDDPDLTDLLRYGLARAGFVVLTAGTGRAGLHQARTEPIDLVILDLDLPDMDGFQLLAALRARAPLLLRVGLAQSGHKKGQDAPLC